MHRLLLLLIASLMLLVGSARGGSAVVDGVNDGFFPPFLVFAPDTVGWVYQPSIDYTLDGIFSTFRAVDNPEPATRDVTLSLYDAPPSAGGDLLRSGTFSAGPAGGDLGITFDPIDVTTDEDYFIGYESIAGLGLNIVDFGVSLPAPDFQPNPAVQFLDGWYTGPDFSTFSSLADSPGFAAPILRFFGEKDEPKPEPEPPSFAALTISDGNASITVDPNTATETLGEITGGMVDWTTDGVNNIFEQSWYLRVGDAAHENHLATLPLTLAEIVDPNQIHLVYSGTELRADLLYTLTGGAEGSGSSTIEETLTLTNLDASNSLPVALFEYDDVDIPVFDTNTVAGDVAGITQEAAGTALSVIPGSPTPDAFQIDQAYPVQTLRTSLLDTAITNLANSGSPLGPTDADFAFQWNLTIPADDSVTVSVLKSVESVLTADFNVDGRVDGFDFLAWQRGESPNPLSAVDLALWDARYGADALGTAVNVPEPAAAVLLVCGLALCCPRRQTSS